MKTIKTVTIISLSSGTLGEPFARHELEIGLERLKGYGLKVKLSKHALDGRAALSAHPQLRAQDLLDSLRDEETDMILCAIGGDDTYRLLPYLFGDNELKNAACDKVFLGFSDTTVNHLMLHKVGMKSFYGQAFLPDICELDSQMLPYTAEYFEELISTGTIRQISPAEVWYSAREDFGPGAIGTPMPPHKNNGFEPLQGKGKAIFSGEILGGCIDTLYDIFDNGRYADSVEVCKKYDLFPSAEDWKGKILLLETSEEQPSPQRYREMLGVLKKTGVFGAVSGLLIGKPMDEMYAEEYKRLLVEVINDPTLPIVCNVNVGHATPRCIIPFGVPATVDIDNQVITLA